MTEMILDPGSGAIFVKDCPVKIVRGLSIGAVRAALAQHFKSHIDHGNGYEWLAFQGLSFHGAPCGLSACFCGDALTEVHWGVALPDAEIESGWPTREAIEKEVTFVCTALAKDLSRSFSSGVERFPWGEVWSQFDPKGFMASSGVRYA